MTSIAPALFSGCDDAKNLVRPVSFTAACTSARAAVTCFSGLHHRLHKPLNEHLSLCRRGGLEQTSPKRQGTATGGSERQIAATGDRRRLSFPLPAAPCR